MAFLYNTDIVVAIGFVIFIGVLMYFKVPGKITGMLDARAEKIRAELNEARELREEAQSLLASFERKQKEVEHLAADIVSKARHEASANAEAAKADLEVSIKRRLQAAKDQIASAEAGAIKEVKDRAVTVAIAAAREVIAGKMTEAQAGSMIDRSIQDVRSKLH